MPSSSPTVTVTLEMAQDIFDHFNALLFDNTLPRIPIIRSRAKSYLGAIAYKMKRGWWGGVTLFDFRLRINTTRALPLDVIEDIIIHEMIHLHILHNSIKDTSAHGKVFRSMMNDINTRHNRNIRISYKAMGTGSLDP